MDMVLVVEVQSSTLRRASASAEIMHVATRIVPDPIVWSVGGPWVLHKLRPATQHSSFLRVAMYSSRYGRGERTNRNEKQHKKKGLCIDHQRS